MSQLCNELHQFVNDLPRYKFPFDERRIPYNGIYILFERGEFGHGVDRVVRVGTHTGENQLRSRLSQHFIIENKDRSIFRKNIGRSILAKFGDQFLQQWNLDLTKRQEREKYQNIVDFDKQKQVEKQVSEYIQKHFSFVVLLVSEKSKRLALESKLISTVSLCDECHPSSTWLGLYSPVPKIRESGLWLVNHLYREPLSNNDFQALKELISQQADSN